MCVVPGIVSERCTVKASKGVPGCHKGDGTRRRNRGEASERKLKIRIPEAGVRLMMALGRPWDAAERSDGEAEMILWKWLGNGGIRRKHCVFRTLYIMWQEYEKGRYGRSVRITGHSANTKRMTEIERRGTRGQVAG